MPRALISVSDDGFTYTTLNGATSRYSDTGQAISYLGDYAKETATPLTVTIDDGTKTTQIGIDENGKVGAVPKQDTATEATPDEPSTASSADGSASSTNGAAEHSEHADQSTNGLSAGGQSTAGQNGFVAEDDSTGSNGDSYPMGTPFSGPAAPTAPTVKKTPVRKRSARNRPQRLKKITVPGLVLIGLAILMIGAFVVPNIVPVDSPDTPQTIGSEQQVNPASELSVDKTEDVVPSYDNSPVWEAEVPKRASVTASDRGILLVNDNRLEVLDADTGKSRYKTKIDESPTFAVDTVIDGRPALLWQSGNTAEALFDGESKPKSYQLPEKARITSAGTSVLIKSGNKLSTFGADGLENVPTPQAGSTPMAIDQDELYSSDWNGPVKAQNIKTGNERSVKLESPGDELKIIDWISAGHGKAITLWGEQGASTNSGHRIQLVVHSLEDGSILSTVTTTTDIVGEKSWVRGQAGERAYIGPYLFDLESGLLLMDVSSRDIHLSEPRGSIVPCTMDTNTSCLLAGKHAFKTGTDLLAVVDKGKKALVLGDDSTVRAYPKKSETQDR
ncbi:hypothetical protein SAMN04489752_1564 [Brevibacterium siliguriense]|uniref:PQQ-like domain-containing protein n=1 Tax=Brevibacterium siliguriense TaxID=1136497 RepID=A0A1H1RMS4_9MICO|nr:hypothetical protein [Brevibacterium siliguriense]SDS36952.1 hypothetical protein SAMN04489752_1564 [Brevibacterium siliguriense]